jgi:hypothetical protein
MNSKKLNPNEELKKELQKEFEGRLFPVEAIKPLFLENFKKVTEYRTPLDLGCDLATFKSIDEGKEWNLTNTPITLNGLLSCSAKELDLTSSEYIKLLEEVDYMRDVWKELATPIQNAAMRKVQTRMQLGAQNPGAAVNPKFRSN